MKGKTLFIHTTITSCFPVLPQQHNLYIHNKAFVGIHLVGYIKAFSSHTITMWPH